MAIGTNEPIARQFRQMQVRKKITIFMYVAVTTFRCVRNDGQGHKSTEILTALYLLTREIMEIRGKRGILLETVCGQRANVSGCGAARGVTQSATDAYTTPR